MKKPKLKTMLVPLITLFVLHLVPCSNQEVISEDDFITLLNSKQSTWRAGKYTRGHSMIRSEVKSVTRAYQHTVIKREPNVPKKECHLEGVEIPEHFDSRTQWPECGEVTGRITNQGHCGSCWAVSGASVMSDRLCIQSNATTKTELSAEDLVSCCYYCNINAVGCKSGYPSMAWHYFKYHGIVSGGGYNSFEGCKPYEASMYYYHKSTDCKRNCSNPYYVGTYEEDKHFAKEYYMVNRTPECIQAEIMQKGPVQTIMVVYEDFKFYQDGVYSYTIGAKDTKHSVKILGWGTEEGIPYWLVANSWGPDWGQLDGFFKIRRGNDECAIEQHVMAGNPEIPKAVPKKYSHVEVSPPPEYSHHGFGRTGLIITCVVVAIAVILIVIGVFNVHKKAKETVISYLRFK